MASTASVKPFRANQRPSQSRAAPSSFERERRVMDPSGPPPNTDNSSIIAWRRDGSMGARSRAVSGIDDFHVGLEELVGEVFGQAASRDHAMHVWQAKRVDRAEA